jgi:hypothetical protein
LMWKNNNLQLIWWKNNFLRNHLIWWSNILLMHLQITAISFPHSLSSSHYNLQPQPKKNHYIVNSQF